MYTVSQDFKEKIKDETALKSCLVLFDDLFFSTSDFTDSGVEFNQYFNTSDDLTFGDCPSDTLSFAVIANGKLGGYSFGKCRAYIGVRTASESYIFGDINAHIEVGGYAWTASETGLYCNGNVISTDEYVSLVSDGTKVYAVGTSSSYSANIDGSDGAEYLPHAFMVQKLRSGLSAVFEGNTAHVWDGENVITIEYVPMGQYNVVKPRSTVGDIVEIQDAYDNMNLFDADASQFLESLTYPITLSGIYTALCDFVGVEYVTDTFLYSDTSYASSPFADTSCSLRDILWWIAERARAVAHCDREGRIDLTWLTTSLDIFTAVGATTGKYINANGGLSSHSQWSATDYLFVYPNTEYTFSKTGSGGNASCFAFYTEDKEFISSVGDETTLTFTTPSNARYARFSYRTAEEPTISIVMSATEVLTAFDIGQDGYSVAEYKTPEVTGVLLRSGNGTTLSFGSMTAPYMISANPFISTITNEDLEAYESIPTYIPMEIMVLEADPSVDMGDMIDVRPMVDEILALTNVYDEVYSENDEALSIEAPTYQIPLMNRTLTFMGGIRASYTATGNEIREADLSNTEYNASVAPVTQTDVFNRLTNGGEAQGIYLENGKIYVNAEYMQTGDLTVGGTNGLGNIYFKNSDNVLVSKMNRAGTYYYDSDGTTLLAEMGRMYSGGKLVLGLASKLRESELRSVANIMTFGTYGLDNDNYFPVLEIGRAYSTAVTFTPTLTLKGWTANPINPNQGTTEIYFSVDAYGLSHERFAYNAYGDNGATLFLEGTSKSNCRVMIDMTGLYFMNGSGGITKSYPAS